jgi:hypothetical protein
VLNTDSARYGGSNMGNLGAVTAEEIEGHGHPYSALFTLPPLSISAFRAEEPVPKPAVPAVSVEKAEPGEPSAMGRKAAKKDSSGTPGTVS